MPVNSHPSTTYTLVATDSASPARVGTLNVNIAVTPAQAPAPMVYAEGRERVYLAWDRPDDLGIIHPNEGDAWEWTDAADPTDPAANWTSLQHVNEMNMSATATPRHVQYGQAHGLTADSEYLLWTRACVGEATQDYDNRICGEPSATSAAGTPTAGTPALIEGYARIGHPLHDTAVPIDCATRPCGISMDFTENHRNDITFYPDPDWDGDGVTWTLEAVDPNDQGALEDVFSISGNGAFQSGHTEPLDHEGMPEWEFDVVNYDVNAGASDRARLTVNVIDEDEPPCWWTKPANSASYCRDKAAFAFEAGTKDGLIISGERPDTTYTPPVSHYNARHCMTSPGPCDDRTEAHWSAPDRHDVPGSVGGRDSLQLTGLEPSTECKVQVQACNDEGCRDWHRPGFTGTTGIPMSFGGATIDDKTLTVGTSITETLPLVTGGTPPYTYTLTPDLPSGLTFNAGSPSLSGAPNVSQPTTEYTYRAEDAIGDTVELTFNITVNFARPTDLKS